MGYYTEYDLKIEPAEAADEVASHVLGLPDDDPLKDYALNWRNLGINGHVWSVDSVKWYGHDEDMRRLSETFPEVTFILHGVGEESDDEWRKRYQGGAKTGEQQRPVYTFPNFD